MFILCLCLYICESLFTRKWSECKWKSPKIHLREGEKFKQNGITNESRCIHIGPSLSLCVVHFHRLYNCLLNVFDEENTQLFLLYYAISYTFYPILYFIRITLFYILNYDDSVKHKSYKHGVKWNKTEQILLFRCRHTTRVHRETYFWKQIDLPKCHMFGVLHNVK